MKTEKYIAKSEARARTKSAAAVMAALVFTLLTAAAGFLCFNNGGFETLTPAAVVVGVMGVNALCLWLTVISPNTFGIGVTKFIQILELIASAVLLVVSLVLIGQSLFSFDFRTLVENLGVKTEIIENAGLTERIIVAASALLYLIAKFATLGFLSTLSRSYKGKSVVGTGGAFRFMSVLALLLTLAAIPAAVYRSDVFGFLGIDAEKFAFFKGIGTDFTAYGANEWVLFAAMVLAPLFYLILANIPNGLKKACAAPVQEKAEEKTEPVKAQPAAEEKAEEKTEEKAEEKAEDKAEPAASAQSEQPTYGGPQSEGNEGPFAQPAGEPVFTAAPAAPVKMKKEKKKTPRGTRTAPIVIKGSHLLDFGYSENDIK